MKKTLIALAAVAATGAAFAQSSVTLYGRMDLGHGSVKNTFSNADGTATEKSSTLAGEEHGRTTGRLGVTGTEDLGGGLKAGFNFEVKLNPDNTGGDGFGGARLANLNLTGGFGTVAIGTMMNGLDSLRGYSAATYSVPGGDFLFENGVGFGGLSGRSTNAISYVSPNFGGFVGSIGMVSHTTKETFKGVVVDQSKLNGVNITGRYNAGALSALATTTMVKASGADNAQKGNDSGFAVSYNFGVAKPYLAYEQGKATPTKYMGTAITGAQDKFRAFEIGSTFPMGAFTPYVVIGSGKQTSVEGNVAVETVKTSAFQVGTTYDLSKRTYVYAAVGQEKAKQTTASVPAAARYTAKSTGYKLGLVHSF